MLLNIKPNLDYPTQIAGMPFGSFWIEFMGKIWAIQFAEMYGYFLVIESGVTICRSIVITMEMSYS